ncbi:MAG: DUF167 domain-containing protein [Candidatus Aenigmarchaeota archaeon]|nr:DUF167 domain-containing protein [Candidatus Aenigmarchaeota archaeon]
MLIKVKVFPKAHQNEVIKKSPDQFVVKIKAKPERGLANQLLLEELSKYWQISIEKIRIIRGLKRKNKILEIKE